MNHPIVITALAVVICWSLFALSCSFIHEWIARIKSERGRFFRARVQEQLKDRPNDINWGYLLYRHSNLDLLTQRSSDPASEIDPRLMARTFMDVVGNAQLLRRELSDKEWNQGLFSRLEAASTKLHASDVMQMLASYTRQAGEEGATSAEKIVKLENLLTDWFSQLNTQCSMWYAKTTRRRLFLLGLSLAVVLHIDSVSLFLHFLNHEDARLMTMEYYQENRESLETMANQLAQGEMPTKKDAVALKKAVAEQAKQASLPVGWGLWHTVDWNLRSTEFWMMWFGFLVSALASSIGAPFWFDTLRRFTLKR